MVDSLLEEWSGGGDTRAGRWQEEEMRGEGCRMSLRNWHCTTVWLRIVEDGLCGWNVRIHTISGCYLMEIYWENWTRINWGNNEFEKDKLAMFVSWGFKNIGGRRFVDDWRLWGMKGCEDGLSWGVARARGGRISKLVLLDIWWRGNGKDWESRRNRRKVEVGNDAMRWITYKLFSGLGNLWHDEVVNVQEQTLALPVKWMALHGLIWLRRKMDFGQGGWIASAELTKGNCF